MTLMPIYELLRFSRCRLGITMGLWERRRDLNAYDTLEQRARSLALPSTLHSNPGERVRDVSGVSFPGAVCAGR